MKKFVAVSALAVLLLCSNNVMAGDIKVTIDGSAVEMAKEPVIIDNEVFIPIRALLEPMGASFEWDGESKTVTAINGGTFATIGVNSEVVCVDDRGILLEKSPVLIEDSVYVPLEAVGEMLHSEAVWDSTSETVSINSVYENNIIPYVNCKKSLDIKADDGTVLVKCYINYPQFEGLDSVNSHLEELAEDFINDCKENAPVEEATNMYAEGFGSLPYEMGYTYEVKRNDGDIISILNTELVYMGGAHPNSTRIADNIDAKTGEVVHAEELLDMTSDEVDKAVKEKFEELINSEKEQFFETALEDLSGLIGNMGYYFNADGAVFYANPYELAPYARGFVEVEITK